MRQCSVKGVEFCAPHNMFVSALRCQRLLAFPPLPNTAALHSAALFLPAFGEREVVNLLDEVRQLQLQFCKPG